MSKFVTITADTDASRIIDIAAQIWPTRASVATNVKSGRLAQYTDTEDQMDAMTRELDARGIEWGWA
jgi:hypothetical protein